MKQKFICRLINTFGYSLNQLGQDVKIKKRYDADIAIWRTKTDKDENLIPTIIITVECKAEHIKIRESDFSIGYNFASTINASFFIAVNLKETKIFHIRNEIAAQKLDKLTEIPKAEILSDDKSIAKYIKENKRFTRGEFTKLLSRSHNIIRNNDKLSPEAAFDEISKILFMKIMYERSSTEEMIFSKERFQSLEKNYETIIRPDLKKSAPHLDQDFMQFLFNQTKKSFEDDGLFELKDQIKIKRNSFEMIVEELEMFNLSDTSDDIKGIAFEQFLGKTFRGELGQFFTPRTVVNFMIEILDPQEGEVICDPCCGSGGFLIRAFEYVRDKIDEEIKNQIQKIKASSFNIEFENQSLKEQKRITKSVHNRIEKINQEFDIKNEKSRYHKLSHYSIYGTDANPRMARTAKMNMIMHGDGHGGVHHNDGLLNVNGIFDNRFDLILTNPPFGSRVEKSLKITEADKYTDEKRIAKYKEHYDVKGNPAYTNAMRQITDNIGEPILSLYKTGKMSSLTEVLFIERCLNLLKPGGRMGIVLPEGVLNNSNLQKIRDFVESRAKIVLITSIPQDVFIASGATVKPSLLFFKKFTNKEAKNFNRITNLANVEIEEKYASETAPIKSKLALRGKEAPTSIEKKQLKKTLKELEQKIETEIKEKIKTDFDYQIPIAEVEKAGISTTGAKIENELEPLAKEFNAYRKENNLWEGKFDKITYNTDDNQNYHRIAIVDSVAQEPEIFYGK